MVKWSSPTPQLDQQPTTPAIGDTFSVTETAPALVKLMENGLGTHPLVNVSEHVKTCPSVTMSQTFLAYMVTFNFTHRISITRNNIVVAIVISATTYN